MFWLRLYTYRLRSVNKNDSEASVFPGPGRRGSRGVFTAGVLDFLMEKEVKFPICGGCFRWFLQCFDYVSWQPGRTRDCMIIEDKANSYIATKEALKKHELFDMDMLFDKYPNELFPFDFDTFFQSDTECEMVVTNCAEKGYRKNVASLEIWVTAR